MPHLPGEPEQFAHRVDRLLYAMAVVLLVVFVVLAVEEPGHNEFGAGFVTNQIFGTP